MRKQGNSKYTLEERKAILKEYEESDLTQAEIAKKYGLSDHSTIAVWKKRLGSSLQNAENFVILQHQTEKRLVAMRTGTPEERIAALEQQLKETEAKLSQAEMKVKVLDTMIDIAERQGIKIRKNSGAKQ